MRPGTGRTHAGPWADVDAFWRAANYLSVGQIYLLDGNPLLDGPLERHHVKRRLLGHWGTTPGLNFVYAHLNRAVVEHDLESFVVVGPGHGGPAALAAAWLDGSLAEVAPDLSRDAEGMGRLFRQFSFPGGLPSHAGPEVPGSIHEGGELGYSLAHALGAASDDPDVVVTCVIGDGEAETGPLAASWQGTRFLDPAGDGAVLPVLHLNGYKIDNPTVLGRMDDHELAGLLRAHGWEPLPVHVDRRDPVAAHEALGAAFDTAIASIRERQATARDPRGSSTPAPARWPTIVLRSPKGWTGPAEVDGVPVEGTWRSHQVPLDDVRDDVGRRRQLEDWMRSYHPRELFHDDGSPTAPVTRRVPTGDRRLGADPRTNGGREPVPLELPAPAAFGPRIDRPGATSTSAAGALGEYLEAVIEANADARNFRLFGPDETTSNRLDAVFGATDKAWQGRRLPTDEHLAPDGRVVEVLSEHLCQGWLEGYVLTGRHGVLSCYEAFTHIVASMYNQHAKWLATCRELEWRRSIPSLNYLLTSHVWRQDHNGFSHQDPGFLDHVAAKPSSVSRIYLPPDATCLVHVFDRCLRSRDLVNVVVAGKHPAPVWLDAGAAADHVERGFGTWSWAGTEPGDAGADPDVVMACAGDVPTMEVVAAAQILRSAVPDLAVRVVNVVDLLRLQSDRHAAHGASDDEFDAAFATDVPIVFAHHGYPALVHRLTYDRRCHRHLHVRGFQEHGSTTTPFDMVVRNGLDRFRLVRDVIALVPGLTDRAGDLDDHVASRREAHHAHVREHGDDLPEITGWEWDVDATHDRAGAAGDAGEAGAPS